MSKSKEFQISIHQFQYIHGKKYRPNIPQKYVTVDDVNYLNTAIPTDLMMVTGEPENEPKAILDLLFNLLGENCKYAEYFLNWLAYNFTYGIKPQVAVVLFGAEGTGKNILYYIMNKLYGSDNCSQINAESFSSNYKLASYLKEKRFVNFDEVTMSVSRNRESFFKAVITNDEIMLGKKVELHAQCLFTANYSTVFKIQDGDRRYSIFQTSSKLEDNNFLGFGSYEVLKEKINSELVNFAKYLKSLDIDTKLANTAYDTPEKKAIIGLSKNYIKDFHKAISSLDITYFYKLRTKSLLDKMNRDFTISSRINRAHLSEAYEDLFGEKISTSNIMNQLRLLDTDGIFETQNIKHSGNNHYIYPRTGK